MADGEGGSTIRGYVGLLRVGNCAMGALATLIAALICVGAQGADEITDYQWHVAVSMAVVFLFTGAGNSMNDYFDRETDRIVHPGRPIPLGLASPSGAIYLSLVLFGTATILSVLVSAWSFVIVLTSLLAMVSYELALKDEGLAGNVTISWLTGALFLFGGAAVERMDVAWILCALAFLATLGREIVKDVQDISGDSGSRRTLPMRVGERRAGVVASASFMGAVVLSPAPYLLDLLSPWYVPAVAVADAIFIYAAMVHFADPERGQTVAKAAMLVALAAFFIGGMLS